jgi:alpha,alpha-trehalose phosphorylase
MRVRGCVVEVEVQRAAESAGGRAIASGEQRVTYRLLEGDELRTCHHGEPVELRAGDSVTLDVRAMSGVEPVSQPPGREPQRRVPTAG